MSNPAGLNIVFAGTPEFSARHLDVLLASHHRVVSAYTQPDRPAGRGKKLTASPVKAIATEAGVPVFQPASLKGEAEQAQLQAQQPDIMVVVAYGLILPEAVLKIPRLGCINVHASLLPRWRGAAPIQRAIAAGDTHTGITIMQMDAGLDTGAMLHKIECPISADETASSLHDKLAELGPPALIETLDALRAGAAQAQAQEENLATYAHKLSKEEAQIDWSLSAQGIEQNIRAYNPFPVAFTTLKGERLRIFAARALDHRHSTEPGTVLSLNKELLVACGHNTALALEQVQLPGKKAMPVQAILNGSAALFESNRVLGR